MSTQLLLSQNNLELSMAAISASVNGTRMLDPIVRIVLRIEGKADADDITHVFVSGFLDVPGNTGADVPLDILDDETAEDGVDMLGVLPSSIRDGLGGKTTAVLVLAPEEDLVAGAEVTGEGVADDMGKDLVSGHVVVLHCLVDVSIITNFRSDVNRKITPCRD